MRGEHCEVAALLVVCVGSSPHARGTPCFHPWRDYPIGIIPACAGNTVGRPGHRARTGDHPRMRGEHRRNFTHMPMMPGSSPHARGTPTRPATPRDDAGIIPACAGNTLQPLGLCGVNGDHPRMRGEHFYAKRNERRRAGSSPHARGTPVAWYAPGLSAGIIPACAGNTRSTRRTGMAQRDHPRMRGEHSS